VDPVLPDTFQGSAVEAAWRPQATDKLTHNMKPNQIGLKENLPSRFCIALSLAFYPEGFEASTIFKR
jgi:hypothetical protein